MVKQLAEDYGKSKQKSNTADHFSSFLKKYPISLFFCLFFRKFLARMVHGVWSLAHLGYFFWKRLSLIFSEKFSTKGDRKLFFPIKPLLKTALSHKTSNLLQLDETFALLFLIITALYECFIWILLRVFLFYCLEVILWVDLIDNTHETSGGKVSPIMLIELFGFFFQGPMNNLY